MFWALGFRVCSSRVQGWKVFLGGFLGFLRSISLKQQPPKEEGPSNGTRSRATNRANLQLDLVMPAVEESSTLFIPLLSPGQKSISG